MKTRKLGKSDLSISEVGFGAWGIGKSWWGPENATDDRESLLALRLALEKGVNFIDTAYVYGDGHSEELIARALKEWKGEAHVATKIPPKDREWPANPETPLRLAFPEEWIVAATERSLSKLNVETIDIQQFHVWSDAWVEKEEWQDAIQKLKKQGKIRYFGVSINDCEPDSAMLLVSTGLVDCIQVIYNIFEQAPQEKLFPLCQKMGVGVIVRVPFDEGSLTGMLDTVTQFPAGDFRENYFAGERRDETQNRVDKLKVLLGPHAPTLPQLALKFILANPAVSVVIPGMRKAKHVMENIQASDGYTLPANILQALKQQAWSRNYYI